MARDHHLEQSERLRGLLTDKSRRTCPAEARKTMLTGILRCGHCGQKMVSRPRIMSRPHRKVPRYTCNPDRGGCGPDLSAQLGADEERRIHLAAEHVAGEVEYDEWKAGGRIRTGAHPARLAPVGARPQPTEALSRANQQKKTVAGSE